MIGVWGANYYAHSGATLFSTQDRDLFLPPDPAGLLAAWRTCERFGLELFADTRPLDVPRDDKDRLFLAIHKEALRRMLGDADCD